MLVEVDAKVVRNDRPDPDIEFSTVEEKRMLDVLLHDPRPDLWIALKNALIDLSQSLKDLDATALVQAGRLDQPHILLAVLDRHAFLLGLPTGNLLEPIH